MQMSRERVTVNLASNARAVEFLSARGKA